MNEHAHLEVDGAPVEVRRVAGTEAVDRLFAYRIVGGMLATSADVGAWHGAPATLTLHDGHGGSRTIAGVVAEAESEVHDDGTMSVTVQLVPRAFMASLGRDCRYFLDKTVPEIVSEVLGGVPHRWELGQSYAKRAYTAQYREDDWSFAARLLEEEGIYFWFDHAEGSLLVMADESRGADDLVGGATIDFHVETGMLLHDETIYELGDASRLGPSKFTRRSFDPDKPNFTVAGSAGDGDLEIYDAPGGGSPSPSEMDRQAAFASASAAAGRAGLAGRSSSARIVHGRRLEVTGHPLDRFNDQLFVTAVSVSVVQRKRETTASDAERSFETSFRAIPARLSHRPPRTDRAAQQAGLQSGTVMGPPGEEIHTDDRGRVRVRMHWARQGGDGWWFRVAQRGASESLQMPRCGWNVLTFNDEGAIDAPSVLSRILDAEHPPPYALPDNKTRVVFRTHTSPADGTHNEIYFEDQKGAEQMFIHASKDMDVLVLDTKDDTVDRDSSHKVGRDHELTVFADRTEKIGGNQEERIGGNEHIEVASTNDERVEGDLSVTIGGNRKVEAGSGHNIVVGKSRSLQVGSALIDTSLGDIQAGAEVVTTLVGGARVSVAASSIMQKSDGVALSAVGGLRLRMAQDDCTIDARDSYLEAVGGLLMQKTKGKYVDGATKTMSWTAGDAVALEAKEVFIKGQDKIEIVCGDSSITLWPDKVEIAGKNVDVSKAPKLVVKTAKVEHN